ncbi:MAG: CBS domain-containing protein [Spirochaetia bacterium]|jgi:tRNA nucleotidyltransferase (CCA-adding enzyme)
MRIIVGHTNMDLDCFGSLALARVLYPGYQAVRSRLIHPVARTLYNLYADYLDMASMEELSGVPVEKIVVVDTRSLGRIKEYLQMIDPLPPVEVWDHHPEESSDIDGAVVREAEVGANTTLLAGEAMRRGCILRTEDATIALTGIYADTGNFTHESVRSADFEAAAWLISQGASLPLVKSFLRTLTEESQITLFHELLNRLSYQTVHGHLVLTVYREMDRQFGGLAAVVEKVFEVESPDALFAVFAFTRDNETLIIARSQAPGLDVSRLLRAFGGGGHAQAASALLKGEPGRKTFHALQACLKTMLADAVSAAAIMERRVETIRHDWSLLDASRFLEDSDRSGMPVIDPRGKLCGYLSLRDIMKARRGGQMTAPVSSHMVRRVVAGSPASSLREIENLFFTHSIYDLPIVDEDRIVGIVTRDAYLRARAGLGRT